MKDECIPGRELARLIALAGIPLSLLSFGATISLALVSLFGVAVFLRDRDFPEDLKAVFYKLLALYLLILIVELINGGSLFSLAETAFNYLPLIAVAPYAFALRKIGLSPDALDRTIWATLALGAAISVVIAILSAHPRPGGLDMDALSYGYVLVVWMLFTFSSALERRRESIPLLILLVFSLAVLLYAKTKIVIICVIVGFLVVGIIWAIQSRRWRTLLIGTALSIVPFGLVAYYLMWSRMIEFAHSLTVFLDRGEVIPDGSFGVRMQQNLAGWRAFLDKPIIGHGLAETRVAIGPYFNSPNPDFYRYIVHNDYIVHMVAFGAFGLVFLLCYFIVALMLMRGAAGEVHRRAGVALVATLPVLMVAFVVFNMSPMSGLVAIAMGIVLSTPPKAAGQISA